MCNYLTPPRNGTYYFRRAVPAHLRSIIGKRDFLISLGVKDREAAKRLILGHIAKTQHELDAAQAEFERAKLPAFDAQPSGTTMSDAQSEWLEENAAYWEAVFNERENLDEDAEAWEERLKAKLASELSSGERLALHLIREARDQTGRYRHRY